MLSGSIARQGIGHLDQAWQGPVLKKAIGPLIVCATTPEVKTPVRCGFVPGGSASARASAVK